MFKFVVVAKKDQNSQATAEEIRTTLKVNGWILDEIHPNFVIVIGGDGTILRAIHQYMHMLESVSFLGIHTGTLGFYTEYDLTQKAEAIKSIVEEAHFIEYKPLLEVEIITKKGKMTYYAINEMRLENVLRTQVIEISIDGEHLETLRANGVCVSTPSGSTAYNKSLGGAVIYPGLEVIQLCEVAGIHHNKYHSLASPILLSKNQILTFTSNDFSDISLLCDHVAIPETEIVRVNCSLSKRKVAFLRDQNYSFIKRLRNSFISD